MRAGRRLILLSLSVALVGFEASARKRELPLTLRFVPQESIGAHNPEAAGTASLKPVRVSLQDGRNQPDKQLVGQGQTDDDEPLPVRASGDVRAFCEDVLLQVLAEWGVVVAPDAELSLEVKLLRFFVMESDKAVGSTYSSDARVEYSVSRAGGESLYTGSSGGTASRYGKSRSVENVNEVLSDALKEAFANMIDDASLRQTLQAVESAPAPAPSGAVSPDGLLAELVELQRGSLSLEFLVGYTRKKVLTVPLTLADIVRWKAAGIPEEAIEAATTLPVTDKR